VDIQTVLEITYKFITIIGLVVGGIFAYYKFVRGRIYNLRLEPEVHGEFIEKAGINYLNVTMAVKNIGLSRITIQKEGSALSIFSLNVQEQFPEVHMAEWDSVGVFDVYPHNKVLESVETLGEIYLFEITKHNPQAFKIELRIVAKNNEWTATAVVFPKVGNGGT
jgi:hypothetical protein